MPPEVGCILPAPQPWEVQATVVDLGRTPGPGSCGTFMTFEVRAPRRRRLRVLVPCVHDAQVRERGRGVGYQLALTLGPGRAWSARRVAELPAP
jgi:hypothetical protein